MYRLEGRWYQFAGKIREWLGIKRGNETAVEVGRHDQLVGKIAADLGIPIMEAELLADKFGSCYQHL
jgi:uncharacterized protein YjbJ (UPF0337 family)